MDERADVRDGDGPTGAQAMARAGADSRLGSREDVAAARDADANRRDTDADHRDRASEAEDEARRRPGMTRVDYRAGAQADRECSAEDRHASALDREAAREELARAVQQIESLMHDHLTGFYQTGAGWIELERQVARSRRTGEPFTIAFVDVDGLKTVNDAHGHAAGDRLIRLVSDAIRSVLREYDLVVRYGGDEFVCGILGLSESQTGERFALMQAQLDEGGEGAASVGVAQLRPTESLQEVVSRADRAMYAGKSLRRKDP